MKGEYILFLLGATLVTYLPRLLPLAILTKMDIPEIIIRWLRYIPVAILAALLAPGLLIIDGKLNLSAENINILAAIPTFLIAVYKKNIFLTVIVGMLSVVFLRIFI